MQTIKYEEEEEKSTAMEKVAELYEIDAKKCNGFDVKSSAEMSIDNINCS